MAGDLMAILRPVNGERRSSVVRDETVAKVATEAQIKAALTRLEQIINASGGTLAQTQAALKDVATYERALIKVVTGA